MLSAHTDSDFFGIGNPKVSQLFVLVVLCACQLFVFYYYFTLRRNIVAEAMIDSETMLVFFGVANALAAVPGPDNIFVLTQSAVHGRISGLIVTLGIALGLFVHTTAFALGVAVIFQTSQ